MICDTHRVPFIFIRNHKTASTSMCWALRDGIYPQGAYCYWPHAPASAVREYLNDPSKQTISWEYGEERVFEPKAWSEYFSFAFVRNPFDWLVSGYHFKCRVYWTEEWMRGAVERGWSQARIDEIQRQWSEFKSMGFREWVRRGMEGQRLKSQKDYVEGVRFVGRYENIQDDYQVVCDRLEIENYLSKYQLQKWREWKPYQDEYDDETREIVSKRYAEDLSYFGYA